MSHIRMLGDGSEAREKAPTDFRCCARGVVERRIGPLLDFAGEGAGDVRGTKPVVKAPELRGAACELDYVNGPSCRRRLAHHVDGIGGNENHIALREQAEIRILAV